MPGNLIKTRAAGNCNYFSRKTEHLPRNAQHAFGHMAVAHIGYGQPPLVKQTTNGSMSKLLISESRLISALLRLQFGNCC
jgi:hypothetical protein